MGWWKTVPDNSKHKRKPNTNFYSFVVLLQHKQFDVVVRRIFIHLFTPDDTIIFIIKHTHIFTKDDISHNANQKNSIGKHFNAIIWRFFSAFFSNFILKLFINQTNNISNIHPRHWTRTRLKFMSKEKYD